RSSGPDACRPLPRAKKPAAPRAAGSLHRVFSSHAGLSLQRGHALFEMDSEHGGCGTHRQEIRHRLRQKD
ncbi:DNA binding domain, excisionase family, partial [Dysosmobacter welbionis]